MLNDSLLTLIKSPCVYSKINKLKNFFFFFRLSELCTGVAVGLRFKTFYASLRRHDIITLKKRMADPLLTHSNCHARPFHWSNQSIRSQQSNVFDSVCDRLVSTRSASATGEVSARVGKNNTDGFLQSLQIVNWWCDNAGKACKLWTKANSVHE